MKEKLNCINMMQKDGIYIASVLDTRRTTQRNLYLVKTRVTYGKLQKYYPTGAQMSVKDWERLIKAKDLKLSESRRSIEASALVIYNAVVQLCEMNEFSYERLNALLGRGNKHSVNAAFHHKINKLLDDEKLSTAAFYHDALNSFICFKCAKWCNRTEKQKCKKEGIEITFQEITAEQMQRYEKESLAHGAAKATIGMRIRSMRAICNDAVRDGIMRPVDYCFKKGSKNSYTIKKSAARKISLTLEEFRQIAKADIPEELKMVRMTRDFVLFSFWANGMNMADMLRLKWGNYDKRSNEFTFVREKTKDTSTEEVYISFPLFPKMKEIALTWGDGNFGKDDLVFPVLKNANSYKEEVILVANTLSVINNNLKRLVKLINATLPIEEHLPQPISSGTARHSYATILAHKRVPESYIGFALGHSRKSVTDFYIEEYSVADRKHYNSMLQFDDMDGDDK